MKNIWQQQAKPFFVLAPMDDVTDTVFREVVARAAAPDMAMTEFASSDGFAHPKGRASVERRLKVTTSEMAYGVPLIAQIWGNNPDHYYEMAKELSDRNQFAGIDINMGCPEKGIVKRGCCGGLIKEENWDTAAAIIEATKAGAGNLPVSVKTRIGLNRVITEEWCSHLLRQNVAALTVHGRTVRELSRVPARWDEIGKVAKLGNAISPQTIIIGNGDVVSREHGEELALQHKLDGVMIGRGIFQNLFVFAEQQTEHSAGAMIEILLQHIDLYEATWSDSKSYSPLKKFCKLYINGFPGASELRARLMETTSPMEARLLLEPYRAAVAPI